MRTFSAFLLVVLVVGPAAAQQVPTIKNSGPKFDVSVGYDRTQANAPPGDCQCFGVQGGYASGAFFLGDHLAVVAQFSGGTSSHISSLGQNLNLYTYLFGPKYAYSIHRVTPFVQVLFGGAHGTDSYFPSNTGYATSASTFALAPGGGVDIDLTRHFSVRAIQAQYLRPSFPNGGDNEQNQLKIGAGLVFKFGQRTFRNPPPSPPTPASPLPEPPPPPRMEMSCSADATSVQAGQGIAITGHASPDTTNFVYTWNTSGGRLIGMGSRVSLDTTGLPEGNYTVSGRVSPDSNPSMTATCEVTFAVSAPPPPPPPTSATVSKDEKERDFRANVHDVYFDVNKSDLRPDSIETIKHDAEYLVANPDVMVTIGGFADQRGSAQYNLALGERRAHAVKDELVKDGVPTDHVQIVTFGRDAQTCTAGNEECWQKNRRVAFLMRP